MAKRSLNPYKPEHADLARHQLTACDIADQYCKHLATGGIDTGPAQEEIQRHRAVAQMVLGFFPPSER